MKGYETWRFNDRPFLGAVAMSLLWHFFWFFSITIVVSPPKPRAKPMVKIVSIGPVLDDSIFRTLVDTKPQLSETFYRNLSQLPANLEPRPASIERRAPGEVISVPFGRRLLNSMRDLLDGDKSAPENDFTSRLGSGGYPEESLEWEEAR